MRFRSGCQIVRGGRIAVRANVDEGESRKAEDRMNQDKAS